MHCLTTVSVSIYSLSAVIILLLALFCAYFVGYKNGLKSGWTQGAEDVLNYQKLILKKLEKKIEENEQR